MEGLKPGQCNTTLGNHLQFLSSHSLETLSSNNINLHHLMVNLSSHSLESVLLLSFMLPLGTIFHSISWVHVALLILRPLYTGVKCTHIVASGCNFLCMQSCLWARF